MALLLRRLHATLDLDPLIDEYAIMPQVNSSLFGGGCGDEAAVEDHTLVAAEHKLAISVEAALVLYRSAFRRLQGAATLSTSGTYLSAEYLSRAVLLCSPDCAVAWSCRENLVHMGKLSIDRELKFNALLLRTNHKSGESWAFRRFMLATGLAKMSSDGIDAQSMAELDLVEDLARRHDHHYYAWNHWAWVNELCSSLKPFAAHLMSSSFPKLVHVTPSHYGLFHHRIVQLCKKTNRFDVSLDTTSRRLGGAAFSPEVLELHASELELASKLIMTFPYMEAPWAFRLQLFAALLEVVSASSSTEKPSLATLQFFISMWRSESAFAVSMLTDSLHTEDCAQKASCERFAKRFRIYLLQELAMHAYSWYVEWCCKTDGANHVATKLLKSELMQLASVGLEAAVIMESERIVSPAIMRGLREELNMLAMLDDTPN